MNARQGGPQRGRARAGAQAGAAVLDGPTNTEDGDPLCTCCDPRNPLVLRPDLGTLPDGAAEYALCVLHEPDPTVYRNGGDGVYVQIPGYSLSPAGEILDGDGRTVARVASDGFQRLTTVDDDEPPPGSGGGGSAQADPGPDRPSQPRTVHVDLTQDDFYAGARP